VMRRWCERHRSVCIIQIDAVHSVRYRNASPAWSWNNCPSRT
jgi:hypothetical protein